MGAGAADNVLVLRQHGERHFVERFGRAAEDHVGRGAAQRGEEIGHAEIGRGADGEIERGRAGQHRADLVLGQREGLAVER